MIILGLAGHVDHGKTALVQALTGIDTDRLPEEKARGMTTDLGFAFMCATFENHTFDVGVIDVPGHERYMRNMVAGAWSLDLALLVVAADDGWMEQTENHARVLAALSLPKIILVVTKTDKVDAGTAESVAHDAWARACTVFGQQALASVHLVSVHANKGIEALESAIAKEASHLESGRKPNSKLSPFLFVDRVFIRKGSGLIACGTLIGGAITEGDEIQLLPAAESLRVKSIESLGARLVSVRGPARIALNLSKAKHEIHRGDMLIKAGGQKTFALSNTEFLIKIEALPSSSPTVKTESEVLKKGGEIEIAVGTAGRIATIAPLGKSHWYRLICRESLALPQNLPLALIRQGGADILGRAWVIREGKTDRTLRKRLVSALIGLEILSPAEVSRTLQERLLFPKAKPSSSEKLPLNQPPSLSLSAIEAEKTLRKAWFSCLDFAPSAPKPPNAALPPRKDMDALCFAGIAIPIDRHLFIHKDAYDQLLFLTLGHKHTGDSLEIAEAKESTGYSRKLVIPFLNRMERDGYVKRDGDRRIVLMTKSKKS
jgi:small GTP-binding protein